MAGKGHLLHSSCLPCALYCLFITTWLLYIQTINWESNQSLQFSIFGKVSSREILSSDTADFDSDKDSTPDDTSSSANPYDESDATIVQNANVPTITNEKRCLQSYFQIWNKCCINHLLLSHLEYIGFNHTISNSIWKIASNITVIKLCKTLYI